MIEIKNLYKSYNGNPVLNNMNLTINRNEILVILGRSGVGKSVLLKHIIGIEQPDSGSVFINNVNITTLKAPKIYEVVQNMGMLFQNAALFDSMNIEQNTGFY